MMQDEARDMGVERRRTGHRGRRAGLLATALIAGAAAPLLASGGGGAAVPHPHLPAITETWARTLGDAGAPIALSSPNVAELAGGPAVVVGDRAGHVYAYNLATGVGVPGWPASTGGVPVDSTPSVATVSGTNIDTVYVGVGNAATPSEGGYEAFNSNGSVKWFQSVDNPGTDTAPAHAVQAGMTVGWLQGGTDVVAGSLGEVTQAMSATTGGMLPGFPWFQADSNFTTPAIADLYSNSQNVIVEGGDSTAGLAYGQNYTNGGHLRVILPSGNAYQSTPAGGVVCQYNTDQVVQSSPAVGEFLGGGGVGIVFGTGAYYGGASTTNDLIALNSHCGVAWTDKLDGYTTSSPALADVEGNGQLQVIEGTRSNTVYALNGATGAALWSTTVAGQVFGSVVTADLTGAGYQDVIVPTTAGVQIIDGRSGHIVQTIGPNVGYQSSPLVTDDPNGTIGITIAGYGASNEGVIEHYEVAGSHGSTVDETGAWPMFHHDPQLTGDAGTPPPVVNVPCKAPSGPPVGYLMSASDGGIFRFGNLPFCGSTGNLALAAPVVGMAMTSDGGGYWEVASDGGIFRFGDAGYYGSMGGHYLAKPIVGMAATSDGKGYWLVASDGGIFRFGDAGFYGSMGGHPLNRPVVGMAADNATGGYWEVASDGGIFTFRAPFFGSTGNLRLARPVVGMEAAPNGQGYRFVASDGGIFDFHAAFYGSMGGHPLNRPVVGIGGF
jgi:hypothetical protein